MLEESIVPNLIYACNLPLCRDKIIPLDKKNGEDQKNNFFDLEDDDEDYDDEEDEEDYDDYDRINNLRYYKQGREHDVGNTMY